MNIEGLSEATLEKLIGRGWIHSYLDLYRLDQHRDEIIRMEGFGVKSWQRLWDAVQQSRNTTFERYVIAMDIPMAVLKNFGTRFIRAMTSASSRILERRCTTISMNGSAMKKIFVFGRNYR